MRKPITYVALLIVSALMLLVCIPEIPFVPASNTINISVTQNGDTTFTSIEAGIPCTLTVLGDYSESIDSIRVDMGRAGNQSFEFTEEYAISKTFIKTFNTSDTLTIKVLCYLNNSQTPKDYSKQITLVCSKPKVSSIKGPTSIQLAQICSLSVSDTSLSAISMWDWYKNDTLLTLSKTSQLIFTSMSATDTGNYSCIITNVCGAQDTTDKFHLAFPAKPADVTGPELTLLGIQTGATVSLPELTISGSVVDTGSAVASVSIKVNSSPTLINATITNGSWSALVTLPLGKDTLVITATDTKGNPTSQTIYITYDPTVTDVTPPVLTRSVPSKDADTVSVDSVLIKGTAIDVTSGIALVTVNKDTAKLNGQDWSFTVKSLTLGKNVIIITATDKAPAKNSARDTIEVYYDPNHLDKTQPSVAITSPTNNSTVSVKTITVLGSASDNSGISSVIVNGTAATLGTGNAWSVVLSLVTGSNTINAIATDGKNNKDTATITVTYDSTASDTQKPTITPVSPLQSAKVTAQPITIQADVKDNSNITSVSINGVAATIASGSIYQVANVPLTVGLNTIPIIAIDASKNLNKDTLKLLVTYAPPPVIATNAGITLDEGATRIISDSALKVTQSGNSVDSTLVYTLVELPKSGTIKLGTTALAASGTFTQANIKARALSYVNNGSEAAKDSIAFTVSDGKGGSIARSVFIMSINPINDAPVLKTNTGLTVIEGASGIVGPIALQVTDADNTPSEITYTLTVPPTKGALKKATATLITNNRFTQDDLDKDLLVYNQTTALAVADSFVFTVADPSGAAIGATTFKITISNINHAPVARDSTYTVNEDDSVTIVFPASDPDNNLSTYNMVSGPSNGTISGSGNSRRYKPKANWSGLDTIKFTATDNANLTSNQGTITITVNAVNDAPVITSTAITAAAQAVAYSYSPTATDQENGTLRWSLTGAGALPGNMAIDSSTGKITWTPAAGVTTSGALTLTVTDNGTPVRNAQQVFTISVTPSKYTLTVTTGGGGTASGSDTVSHGIQRDIVAVAATTPAPGYRFVKWTVTAGSGVAIVDTNSASTKVTLSGGNATVRANFKRQYSLTISSDHGASTPVSPATVDSGIPTGISIPRADDGWGFINWTQSGGALTNASSQTGATMTLSSGNASVTANYIQVYGPSIGTIATPPDSSRIGDALTLTVTTSGSPTPTIQWYKNGVAISGANSTSLSLSNIQKGDSGSYYAIAQVQYGSYLQTKTSNSVLVKVLYIKKVSTKWYNTIFLKNNGSLWENGYNTSSQIDNILSPVLIATDVVDAATGGGHIVILKKDGTVWSKGSNYLGQLGVGDTAFRSTFTKTYYATGFESGKIESISASGGHTIIVKSTGEVWGFGETQALGLNDTIYPFYDRPTKLTIPNVRIAYAGVSNTMFVNTNGELWACGLNEYGRCGMEGPGPYYGVFLEPTKVVKALPVVQTVVTGAGGLGGYGYSFYLKNNQLLGMGTNTRIGFPGKTFDPLTFATDVSVFGAYRDNIIYARSTDNTIWSRGFSSIGLNISGSTTTFTQASFDGTSGIEMIELGNYHGFILKKDGSLWGSGANESGQLGIGTTYPQSTFIRVY